MKKQLLIGSALLAAISAFPQNGRHLRPSGFSNMTQKIAAKFVAEPSINTSAKQVNNPIQNPNPEPEQSTSSVAMPPSTINWKLLCGSMNIVGMLVSNSHPLQYNDELNAVSFVHRKSASYVINPAVASNAQSGGIVAEVSTNWGNTFDSTLIWGDANNWGRYPQGGIHNPIGNTTIANAFIVGMGPVTPPSAGWVGNFAASKKLDVFTNTLTTVPNSQQVLASNSATYAANTGPVAFARYGFAATDDGVVRSMGLIMDDASGLTGMRGVSIVKGTFNAGAFTWTMDSIIPAVTVQGDGSKNITTNPQMAWNESGMIGYAVVMGSAVGASSSNLGLQPIIYKTTNGGTSWALIPGIDFNSAAMQPLLKSVNGVTTDSTLRIPQFDDYDMVVDSAGKLHIGAIYKSTFSSHLDSVGFSQGFTVSINPGEQYNWTHTPGMRPYLYDFIGDGSSVWTAKLIDSLSSESADPRSGQPGFNDNPWAPTGTAPAVKTDDVSARVQMGRTPKGNYITFTYAESDTAFTNGQRKFNNLPNVKARCMSINTGTNMYRLSPTEVNVTKVAAGTGTANAAVASRGTLHYMSPTTGSATVTMASNGFPIVDIYTPLTVTNSNPYDPILNNATWYQNGKLSYDFNLLAVGIKETAQNEASNSFIYPNPASNNAILAIDMKENSNVDITVMNAVGQVVKNSSAKAQMGQNKINIDLNGLSSGIYMVNVKAANTSSTKKLIVQ